ncbi:3'(2'),5'-bisphosphate nucleotidase CysQ [Micromonospora sp. WMMD1128]|uniref:inositol monophosphatase family protein n=1 Tax=unclassified Micromonospora TaxID=2617518 RepID=UPI00248B478B|nr:MULTISPECIES: inositol monophosphatase family protein [unclassified Micromonospora]WBB72913.1 3'(2'),5'-bisphosphate nucleotidase CysQ [Micromonospora sp. WMMD1128]WFE33639.1 inositol monophosphatase family protein [Micromonospora sp. WMMD975]
MGSPPVIDGAFARWLASRAGQALVDLRAEVGFGDAEALRSAGDKVSHDLIRTELAKWRPADAVLSEEDAGSRVAGAGGEAAARLAADRVWIVDPLDGTREYAEEGRADWAVHVALWSRRAPTPHGLVAGAVGLPAQHRVVGTDYPPAYPPMPVESRSAGGVRTIRLAASRSRPPVFLTDLAEDVGAHLVPMGSAGAKIAAVVTGEVDAYIHAGGQYEWDSAAPVAVATATGLHASRIDGSALKYNEADPRLPDLLVCRKDLASRLLAALQRHSG